MFSVGEVGGITVLNTVKLLDAVLAQELGALCCPQCCKHCVGDTVLVDFLVILFVTQCLVKVCYAIGL